MKLSEMNNDQAAEVLVKVSGPLSNILNDENIKPLLDEMSNAKDIPPVKAFADMIPKLVSFCMKDHRDDLYEVVGALTFKPASKVGKMNFMATVKELRDSIDAEFIGFFRSSGNATATPGQE